MNHDRLQCPHCGENVPGYCIAAGVVATKSNGGYGLIFEGTVHCRCHATLFIKKGQVHEFAPPPMKPREIDRKEDSIGE